MTAEAPAWEELTKRIDIEGAGSFVPLSHQLGGYHWWHRPHHVSWVRVDLAAGDRYATPTSTLHLHRVVCGHCDRAGAVRDGAWWPEDEHPDDSHDDDGRA